MSKKVILVVLDGLNYVTAKNCMGFLSGLIEQKIATLYRVPCELPSMSRPLYEAILTGVAPVHSGIVNNHIVRNSNQHSVFSLARDSGLTTAAAAYHWFSELYNRSPYDAVRDRFTNDSTQMIQNAIFYSQDTYPDSHLYLDAEWLRRTYDPDFLLVHPMNIDDAGHRAGLDSAHYRNTARHSDFHLSNYLLPWIEADYQVMVTADHGMNNDKSHGGTLIEERDVPLYVIGDGFTHDESAVPGQLEICGTVCELLGIKNHGKPIADKLLVDEISL
ncbi:alkaline phosphatase family protein [Reinekea sp.]|jgi:predicted AlkP superfamily pyrophosphatase or phosphodiesterase|uniref:alkaline phosphatase family protein n=1 Tax=Reinekea sp. TaxID=1970455 RepID=UPI0039897E45